MDTTVLPKLSISYSQILDLAKQLPLAMQLELGRELLRSNARQELVQFQDKFHTDEISDEDIMNEIKAMRAEKYEK